MSQDVIHVYLMPGMAAHPSIFKNISLNGPQFELHKLEWFLPIKGENIGDYALRMSKNIVHKHAVLIGVSFGGILVQEMSKHLELRKLIIVSSVKTKNELPKRMKLARLTKAYKLLPTRLVGNVELFAKYAFGKNVKRRLELYKMYLSVSDRDYLDWAIENMVCWDQETPLPNVIHIHGDKDAVFPISNILDSIIIKGGTHVMILNKYKWFNENLPKLILADNCL